MSLDKLIISTLCSNFDDVPWVEASPGMESKVVHARPADRLMVIQLRAQPGVRSGLHRHLGLTLGITSKGAWSHHPREFPYKVNSYICEAVNELHRFQNGPGVSEVYFVNIGDVEFFDDEGREMIGRYTAADQLKGYMAKCEELGLPRPNVLG